MSARAEISKKNPYWIDKHRYYELKHFCLQYGTWKSLYNSIDGLNKASIEYIIPSRTNKIYDPVARAVEARQYFRDRMNMVEKAALDTDRVIGSYILKGVTEGHPYEHLKLMTDIPCGKDVYYDLYRKFFWLLNIARR